MRTMLLIPATAAGLLVLSGCYVEDWGASERHSREFHFSYPMKPGGRVSVEGFNGGIEISGWTQNTVEIDGTKYASTDQMLDAFQIDVQHGDDYVSVRAVRPSGVRNNTGARFVIKVPRSAQLDRVNTSNGAIRMLDVDGPARLKTSNGSIRAENVKGTLEATSSNGAIEVQGIAGSATLHTSNGHVHAEDVRGSIDATTSNGGINVKLAKVDSGRPIRLETSNGGVELTLPDTVKNDVRVSTNNAGITLHLPGSVNARVSAHTSNSSISTDFQVATQGEISKSRLDGVIGAGGPLLDLNTSNGSIRLLKM